MRNFKIINISLALFIVGMFSISCSRTQDGSMGPSICPSADFAKTSDFIVADKTSGDQTMVDLLASYAKITTSFSESVDWNIEVKGLSSGASTFYKGKGKDIDINWYGEPATGVFYTKNEMVSFTLYVACIKEPIATSQIKVSTVTGLSGFGGVITNFEDSPVFSGLYHKDPTHPCVQTIMTPSDPGYSASPQGENYLDFKCTLASGQKEWYFGGMGFPIDAFATVPSDPSSVYLNVLAKGSDNSQAQLIFKEDVFNTLQTRKFLITVTPNWKLYSVKLSDIGTINVNNIKNLDLNLGAATTQANSAAVALDMIILTKDRPLGE